MIIRTDNLVKTYGERNVVNGVSVEVEQGTIVGLLGPNGAGKTTTFYMIVGIENLMLVLLPWTVKIFLIWQCLNVLVQV